MIINKFVESLEKEGRSELTVKNYKADVNHFVKYLGGTTGDGVSNSAQKAYKNNTYQNEISGPSSAIRNDTDLVEGANVDTNEGANGDKRIVFDEILASKGDKPSDLYEYLTEVTEAHIRDYMAWMKSDGLAVATVNRRLNTLRKLYSVMVDEGLIDSNPTDGVKAKKIAKQNATKWLEDYQVREIFSVINAIKTDKKRALQRAIFSMLVNTGIRAQELCDIKLRDIDWDNGLLLITGKGDKFRRVPINKATRKNVEAWLEYRRDSGEYLFQSERSDQLTVRAIEHMAKNINEQLRFSFTVHQLRHTALKHIADTTGRIEIVASVAGHTNVETSRRYIEPSLKEIGEAMKRTEYDY